MDSNVVDYSTKIPNNVGLTEDRQVLRALEKLSADPKNVVYIISGRDGQFLEQHLGHLENVGFSAEHGGFVRPPKRENGGSSEWMNFSMVVSPFGTCRLGRVHVKWADASEGRGASRADVATMRCAINGGYEGRWAMVSWGIW